MRVLIAFFALAILASCGGSGSGGPGSVPSGNDSVTGVNLSGTYTLHSLECYSDSTLSTLVAQANINPSPSYGLVITGNNTSTTWNDGICQTNIANTYVFTQAGALAGGTYGTYNSTAGNISIPSGQGSCTYTLTWTLGAGSANISPSSLTDTAVNGGTTTPQSGVYLNLNSGYLATQTSLVSAQGYPSGVCFVIYDRQ